MNPPSFNWKIWDPELLRLRSEGHSSAAIAAKISAQAGTHVSRNAVIGRAHRIGQPPLRSNAVTLSPIWERWHEELTTMRDDGYSCTEIASEISRLSGRRITRNAVSNRCQKLGITPSKTRVKPSAGRSAKARSLRPAIIKEQPKPPDMKMLGVLELDNTTCKFPIGDPRDPGFGHCGATCDAADSYCAFHKSIAYQSPLDKRPAVPTPFVDRRMGYEVMAR